jgi:CBS domain-containing protein
MDPTSSPTATLGQQQTLGSPLSTLTTRPPLRCTPDAPLAEVVDLMKSHDVGSMLVCDPDERPLGIFTLYDLLKHVPIATEAMQRPVASVMREGVIGLPPDAPAFEAALAMEQHGIRHVAVIKDGRLVGVVSERDLFALQQIGLRALGSTIRTAASIDDLVRAAGEIRLLAQGMVDQGIGAEQITRFISTLNDMLTARIIDIEFAQLAVDGTQWCWMAMGSEGRFEQTLYTDQDNGIIFDSPKGSTADDLRDQFLPAAQRINGHLARCGFSLCRGGIMAGNPKWCLSLAEWKNCFATWIHRGSAPELLNATIFFDFRALHGAAHLVEDLRNSLDSLIKANRLFLKKMAENALGNRPPLGLIRDFTVARGAGEEPSGIDLKMNGVALFVDAARIFSLSACVHETSTVRRFRNSAEKMGIARAKIEGWIEALHHIQQLRLRNHRNQILLGVPNSNRIDPYGLNHLDRLFLKEALKQAKDVQGFLEKYYRF